MQAEPFLAQGGISVVEEASQRGCAVSILGGSQDPTGSSPEQPGLTSELVLLWAGVELETSGGPIQTELSCDPMFFSSTCS